MPPTDENDPEFETTMNSNGQPNERDPHLHVDSSKRRPLLRAVAGLGAAGLVTRMASTRVRADHETDPCSVTIEYNRAKVARVSDVQAAGLTSLTVFYFDRERNAHKQKNIAPAEKATYGDTPLRVRYAAAEDQTIIQIGGPNTAIRRIVAYGPNCRSAKTNPLDSAAGENEPPVADFTWSPDPATAGEPVTFTSTATDPDGELIHYEWGVAHDGTEDATGEQINHTFEMAGKYDVTHTVIDDFGNTDSVTQSITITESEGWEEVAKLLADDGDQRDNFGQTVAVDENTIVIGARSDEDYSGSAYVFTQIDGGWCQQKLFASDGEEDDFFGDSVAIDGDTIIVGAPGDDIPGGFIPEIDAPEGNGIGSAYVFTRSEGNWSQQQKLTADDGDTLDYFGSSVALDNDTAIIGAPGDEDPNGDDAGSAYVFTLSEGCWSQQQKLSANDGDSYDDFGRAVAVDGDTVAVGTYDEDPNGYESGSVYIFTRSSGQWNQQQKLTPDDGDRGDKFGREVALDRNTVVIGAYHDEGPNGSSAGSAYVFTRSEGKWSQQQKLLPSDSSQVTQFGLTTALDGDTAVIGTYDEPDLSGKGRGSAYVFTRSEGNWSQQQKLIPEDDTDDTLYGWAVAVDRDVAVVGAPWDGHQTGSAYVFER